MDICVFTTSPVQRRVFSSRCPSLMLRPRFKLTAPPMGGTGNAETGVNEAVLSAIVLLSDFTGELMRVEELMTKQVQCCLSDDSLERAAQLMWDYDCGSLPVCASASDGANQAVGMITDRDICMSALLQGKALHELRVCDAMSKQLLTCRCGDTLDRAEKIMREGQIRRLPVLSEQGALMGVISLADLAREAARESSRADKATSGMAIGGTLAQICTPRPQSLTHPPRSQEEDFMELDRSDPFGPRNIFLPFISSPWRSFPRLSVGADMKANFEWSPLANISETDGEYLIRAEIPGINKDDLTVSVSNGTITIEGEHKLRKEENNERFHQIEQLYGSFWRSFWLPDHITPDAIRSEYRDGVLTVHIPKTMREQLKQIPVQ